MQIRSRWFGGSAMMMAILGLILTITADFLFHKQPIGWTLGLFVMLWATVVILKRPRKAAFGLWCLLLGLAISMAIEPNTWNILLALLGLASLASVARSGWTSHVRIWLKRWGQCVFAPLIIPMMDMTLMRHWQSRHNSPSKQWQTKAVQWIVPVILGAVFLGLFGVANPVIAQWIESLHKWATDQMTMIDVPRMLLWALVLVGTWALFRLRTITPIKPNATATRLSATDNATLDWVFSPPVVLRCLLLFNLIFALQTTLDMRFLLYGAALPQGMSHSMYARRGAYPLVATALLAGLFVMVTFRDGGAAEKLSLARKLVYLWILQNLLLLGSAAWRLSIYIDAYTLTRWRFAAGIWMGMVAIGFVLIIARILTSRSNAWLGRANALLLLVVLYACCFVNFDGIIARYNVTQCLEIKGYGVPIDLAYLQDLGIESLPALRQLKTHTHDPATATKADELARQLSLDVQDKLSNWRGWTWQRAGLTAE